MGGTKVQAYTVGQTGTLYDPVDQVPLATVMVSSPTFSTSDANGDTPQYGYFATFTITVTDIAPASSQDTIGPDDGEFYIAAPNGSDYGNGSEPTGVLTGNGYEAEGVSGYNDLGTNSVGGAVDLNPGQSTTGQITIDCPSEHGQLYWDDGGQNDGYWSF